MEKMEFDTLIRKGSQITVPTKQRVLKNINVGDTVHVTIEKLE